MESNTVTEICNKICNTSIAIAAIYAAMKTIIRYGEIDAEQKKETMSVEFQKQVLRNKVINEAIDKAKDDSQKREEYIAALVKINIDK